MDPQIIIAPQPIVTLAEIKAWVRVDFADDDLLLAQTASAATGYLDGYRGILGRCIGLQTWRQSYASFSRLMPFWCFGVQSATVKYRDELNIEQILPSSNYDILTYSKTSFLQFKPSFVFPKTKTDIPMPVTIDFVAGMATVPDDFKVCVLQITAHWYANREALGDMQELPFGPSEFIARNRVQGL